VINKDKLLAAEAKAKAKAKSQTIPVLQPVSYRELIKPSEVKAKAKTLERLIEENDWDLRWDLAWAKEVGEELVEEAPELMKAREAETRLVTVRQRLQEIDENLAKSKEAQTKALQEKIEEKNKMIEKGPPEKRKAHSTQEHYNTIAPQFNNMFPGFTWDQGQLWNMADGFRRDEETRLRNSYVTELADYANRLESLTKDIEETNKPYEEEIARLEGEKETGAKELESNEALIKKYTSDLELRRSAQRLEMEKLEQEGAVVSVSEADREKVSREYEEKIQELSGEISGVNKPWQMTESPHLREHLEAIVDRITSLPEVLRLEVNSDLEGVRNYLRHSRSFGGLPGSGDDVARLSPVASVDRLIKFSSIPLETHVERLAVAALEEGQPPLNLAPELVSYSPSGAPKNVLTRLPRDVLESLDAPPSVMKDVYDASYANKEVLEAGNQLNDSLKTLHWRPVSLARAVGDFLKNIPKKDENIENILHNINGKFELENAIKEIHLNMDRIRDKATDFRSEIYEKFWDLYFEKTRNEDTDISQAIHAELWKVRQQNVEEVNQWEHKELSHGYDLLQRHEDDLQNLNSELDPVLQDIHGRNLDFQEFLGTTHANVADLTNIRPVVEPYEKKLREEGYDFETYMKMRRQVEARRFADTFADYKNTDVWREVDHESLPPRLDAFQEPIVYNPKGERLPAGEKGIYSDYQPKLVQNMLEKPEEKEFFENVLVGNEIEGGGPMRLSSPIPAIVLEGETAHLQSRDMLKMERFFPGTIEKIRKIPHKRIHPQEGVDLNIEDRKELEVLSEARESYNHRAEEVNQAELARLANAGVLHSLRKKAIKKSITSGSGSDFSLEVRRENVAERVMQRELISSFPQNFALSQTEFRPVLLPMEGKYHISQPQLKATRNKSHLSYLGVLNPIGTPILVGGKLALEGPREVDSLVSKGILEVLEPETPKSPKHLKKTEEIDIFEEPQKKRRGGFSGDWWDSAVPFGGKTRVQYTQEDFFANILRPIQR
jgi:hypothetical protein